MKKATSFDECFRKQAEDAKRLQKFAEEGSITREEADNAARSIATSTLRDDLVFQLQNGKSVKMTKRVQELVRNQEKLLKGAGYVQMLPVGGMCLVCGKAFEAGDLVVAERLDTQNCICLSCATGKIEISEDGDMVLAQFK